jgi:hypothetical protein
MRVWGCPAPPVGHAGESQGGTTVTLAHRPSTEQPRHLPARPDAPKPSPIFQLLPEGPSLQPASTGPPRLEEGARGKRKGGYTDQHEAVARGAIDDSTGKLVDPRIYTENWRRQGLLVTGECVA